ncbi:Peptidase S41 [Apiospora arundinis]|uniref:Peptidase S41 n=1 Tax=Apiospora arundinis TaxID=335852 RepID=A0ABR2IVA8_9PEZI
MRNVFTLVSALHLARAGSIPQEIGPRAQSDACTTLDQNIQSIAQKATDSIIVTGQQAQNCLASLPFNQQLASQFITELRKYVQFQSTLEVLKAPPKGYPYPAIDILGGLDKIAQTKYGSQYEFDTAILNLVDSANDGHFSIGLCSTGLFGFLRSGPVLISASTDGLALPQLYVKTDGPLINSKTASPVTTINGQKATDFLNNQAAKGQGCQDPDANWNSLFPSLALLAQGLPSQATLGGFSNPTFWPGASTELGFANGTKMTLNTAAEYLKDSTLGANAATVFSRYCAKQSSAKRIKRSAVQLRGVTRFSRYRYTTTTDNDDTETNGKGDKIIPPPKSGPTGYPTPVIRDPYNQMMGFSLDAATAVMAITSFDGTGMPDDESAVFANTATKLVSDAIASGRKRLIIDVSANPGGDITRAFDLFRLFFPTVVPYSATRFRRSDATDSLARIYGVENAQDSAADGPFGYRGQVAPDQKTLFASLDSFLGSGAAELGVPVSSLYANFEYSFQSVQSEPIRGFGPVKQNPTAAPYSPLDIIIVGDGFCHSTCTTFVNLMTNMGGVRTVAFGGRPATGPMQIMGGVRGGQSLAFGSIEQLVNGSAPLLKRQPNLLTKDQLAQYKASMPIPTEDFPLPVKGEVNFRNAYQQGDDDTPLQFVYQAADCRLFYTYDNYNDPKTVWQAASDAIWGNKGCVDGSKGAPGSREYNSTHPNQGGSGSGSGSGSGDKKKNWADVQHHASSALGAAMLIFAVTWLL